MKTSTVAPISGGLVEGIAPTEQPPGTYSRGINVRSIDPRTGRVVWGAQRAGLVVHGEDFVGGYPTHFTTAFELVKARQWAELTTTPKAMTVPDQVQETWSTEINEAAVDVSVGPDGQGYVLVESGDVIVINVKGRVVDRIRSAAPYSFTPVPKIEVAEDGSVFIGSYRTEPLDGLAGYLSRWVRQEDKTWERAWQIEFNQPVATFGYALSSLYVVVEPLEDEDEIVPSGEMYRLGAPLLGPEVAWFRKGIPRPVFGLVVNDNGQAVVSFPSNPLRTTGVEGGFGTRSVDWVPQEWPTFDIICWSWVDAFSVNDLEGAPTNGTRVVKLRDKRFEPSDFDALDETSPRRELFQPESRLNKVSIFTPPTWSQDAFGGLGGVRFESGNALVSSFAESISDHREQMAMIPGGDLSGGTTTYTIAMIVQYTVEQMGATGTQRRMFAQQTPNVAEPSWVAVLDGGNLIYGETNQGGPTDIRSGPPTSTPRTAIVTIEVGGALGQGRMFLNGALAEDDPALYALADQGGAYAAAAGSSVTVPGPFTVIGGGRPNSVNLLRHGSVTLTPGPTSLLATTQVERLRDGVKYSSNPNDAFLFQAAGSIGPAYVDIDLGANTLFDSIAWWNNQTVIGGTTVQVESGTVFGTWLSTKTFSPSLNQIADGDPANRDSYNLGLVNHRYIRITVLSALIGDWRVSELEILNQDTIDSAGAGEFALGEMIAFTTVSPTAGTPLGGGLRQRLEGYLAHKFGAQAYLEGDTSIGQTPGVGNHPFSSVPPVGVGSSFRQESADIVAALQSPFPIVAKYGTDGTPMAAYTGAGVGLGAAVDGDFIYTVGEPDPAPAATVPDQGTLLTRFKDKGYGMERQAGGAAGTDTIAVRPTRIDLGPCRDVFVPYVPAIGGLGSSGVRRYDGQTLGLTWTLGGITTPRGVAVAGAQIDESLRGGACGPEFVYAVHDRQNRVRRVDVMGLEDTGRDAGRDAEDLVVLSNGDVVRSNAAGGWDVVEAGALTGRRPASATMFGKTFFADGLGYRVYDHVNGTLRDFEEAVKGEFPPRCRLIAAYRSRLVVAAGDNAFTLYQSRFGDPLDFDYGPVIQSISQAVAGTTASQGKVPEEITSLMPFRDDLLYIGTTESLFVQSGDIADLGRLYQVDKSQGVAFGYAWCEGPFGIYYFSSRGGVVFISPTDGISVVSAGKIQRRLEEIDLARNRVEMAYNWIDKTVHVFVIPNALGSATEHYTYEEPTGGWHVDGYGEGYDRSVSAVASQVGDTPEDRSLFLGFAGGHMRRWDQYAEDDAGLTVESNVLVGPLINGTAGVETRLSGVHGQLATDQAGVEIAVRGSSSADAPGPPSVFQPMDPGRSFGVGVNVRAPAVWIEVRGTGRAWAIHELRAEAYAEGTARVIS